MKSLRAGILAFTCIAVLSNEAFATLKMSDQLTLGGKPATEENIENERASTLAEVYDTALRKNIPYLQSNIAYQQVLTRIDQAKALLRPQVSADAYAGYNVTRGGGTTSNYMSSSAGLSASWVLYNRELKLGVSIAELEVQMGERQLILAQQDLMSSIATFYFQLILEEDKVRLAKENLDNLNELLNFTEARHRQGVFSKDQVSMVRADVISANLKLEEASLRRDEAIGVFEVQFGISFKPFLSVRNTEIPAIPGNMHEWMSEASRSSMKVQINKLALEISNKDISRAKALYSPTVTLQANVSRNNGHQYNSGIIGQERSTGAFVGVFLSIPLYDGGLRKSVTKEKVLQKESVILEGEFQTRQAELDAQKAIVEYNSANGGVRQYREQVELSKQIVKSKDEAVKAGNSEFFQLISEMNTLTERKNKLLEANVRALQAYIELKKAVGSLNVDDLAVVSKSLNTSKKN